LAELSFPGGSAAAAAVAEAAATGWSGLDSRFFDSLQVRRSLSRIDAGGYSSRSRSDTLDSWASGSGPRVGGSGATPLAGSSAAALALLPPGELDAGALLRRTDAGTSGGVAPSGVVAGAGASFGELLPPLGASMGRAAGGGTAAAFPAGLALPASPGVPALGLPTAPGAAAAAAGEPPGAAGSQGARPPGAVVEGPAGWPTWADPALTDSLDGTATRPGAGLGINWDMPDNMSF